MHLTRMIQKHSSILSSATATLVLSFLSATARPTSITTASKTVTAFATRTHCTSPALITFASPHFSRYYHSESHTQTRFPFAEKNRVYSSTKSGNLDQDIMEKVEVTKSDDKDDDDIITLLPYEKKTHNSVKVIIQEDDELTTSEKQQTFQKRLEATIEACRQLKKSSLWITIPMNHASVIEFCVSNIPGFEFHNASGRNANLCIWLDDSIENKIPEYATHQVGVGAIVINSDNEILCVRELRNNYRPWKIPGGLAELGEQLDDASIREVKEETGIDCKFKSVLSFRHTHGMQFGRSDLYFVCRLEPIEHQDPITNTRKIPQPVAQSGEIAAAAWVPFQEYRDMVNGKDPHPMMQKVLEIFDTQNDIERSVVSSIVPGRKPSPIYHAPSSKS